MEVWWKEVVRVGLGVHQGGGWPLSRRVRGASAWCVECLRRVRDRRGVRDFVVRERASRRVFGVDGQKGSGDEKPDPGLGGWDLGAG